YFSVCLGQSKSWANFCTGYGFMYWWPFPFFFFSRCCSWSYCPKRPTPSFFGWHGIYGPDLYSMNYKTLTNHKFIDKILLLLLFRQVFHLNRSYPLFHILLSSCPKR